MRRLVFPLMLALGWVAPAHATIIISEYVEGSAKNQVIELYNYGSTAIDITGWTIDIYLDGSTTVGKTVTLSGTILPGELFVLARNGADPVILAIADQVDKQLKFNGNDAVVLTDGTDPIDHIGQVGVDPGAEWGSGDLSTKDNTIQRSYRPSPTRTSSTRSPSPTGPATPRTPSEDSATPVCRYRRVRPTPWS